MLEPEPVSGEFPSYRAPCLMLYRYSVQLYKYIFFFYKEAFYGAKVFPDCGKDEQAWAEVCFSFFLSDAGNHLCEWSRMFACTVRTVLTV